MIGYSYLVVAKIGDQLRVSDVIQLSDPAEVQTLEDKAKNAYNIIKTMESLYENFKSGLIGILGDHAAKGGKEALWALKYHTLLENPEGNSNIIS